MPAALSTFFDQKQIDNLIKCNASNGHYAIAPVVEIRMEESRGTAIYKGFVHLVITNHQGGMEGLVLRCHEDLESIPLEARYVFLIREDEEWVIKNMIDVVRNPEIENGRVGPNLTKLTELGLF